jgi:hypothetical protein
MSLSLPGTTNYKNMKEVVIAAYDRDYDWVNNLNSDVKVTVYKKGDSLLKDNEILIQPNLGRDVHTFFYHLYTQYDNLSDVTFFSQDFPFDHVANYIEIINGDKVLWNSLAKQHVDGCWFFCTQYGILECDKNGAPHHPGLDLEKMWNTLFPDDECPEHIYFTPTGHFAISKEQTQKIPKDYYRFILDILENETTSPWEIERLEPYIFLR